MRYKERKRDLDRETCLKGMTKKKQVEKIGDGGSSWKVVSLRLEENDVLIYYSSHLVEEVLGKESWEN